MCCLQKVLTGSRASTASHFSVTVSLQQPAHFDIFKEDLAQIVTILVAQLSIIKL